MKRHTFALSLFAILLVASPSSAQQMNLDIKDGLVSLDANGASVRQILDAWARVGGTRIVNGDRVTGAPVTLKLENMPERQALEIILRSVAGYMAAPRAATAAPGASMYDRILILPTSSAPPPPPPTAAGNRGASPRFVPPRARDANDDRDETADEPADADSGAAFTFPQPGQFPGAPGGAGFGQQPAPQPQPGNPFAPTPAQPMPFGQPGNTQFQPVQPGQTPFGTPTQQPTPFGTPVQPGVVPNQPGQTPVFNFTPQGQPVPPTGYPGYPVIGSPVPGVVQQPTQPAQPAQTRPPRD
jgi:hypothetical protein